jgi:heme A synthase
MAEGIETRRGIATALVVMTFVLVLMGALVTSNEAGDSVPGWPLAWGTLVPLGHLSGKVIFEYFHRVVAGLVALVTALLTVLVLLRERRPPAAVLALAALGLVIAQALLGGVRVSLGETHSYAIATLHAFTAQVFLGAVSALLAALSQRRDSAGSRGRRLKFLFLATAVAATLQALLGAGYRHRVLGVLPHGIGAPVVAALVIVTWRQAGRQAPGKAMEDTPPALGAARRLAVTVGAQFLLGAVSWLLLGTPTGEASTAAATVIVAVLHLGLGSAVIFQSVTAAFRAAAA